MCNEAVQTHPLMIEHVPDQFVTQEMYNKAVNKSPCVLWCYERYVLWCYEGYVLWYKGYQQCKAQKAKIKEELMSVAWHPDRW